MCLALASTTATAAVDDQQKEPEMMVNYDSGHLTVKGLAEMSRVEVCNMLGVKVFSATALSQERNDFNIFLHKGIYIVKVGAEVRRIAVR